MLTSQGGFGFGYRGRPAVVLLTALFGLAVYCGAASAAVVQQAVVQAAPISGAGFPKGKSFVTLDSYLSTRDASSTRGTLKHNPVGKVFMDFPAGGTVNRASGPTCQLSEYLFTPADLEKPNAEGGCASSVIGTGWALLNTGVASARLQLTGAPHLTEADGYASCPPSDLSQYTRTYEAPGTRAVGPSCYPVGHFWVRVTAYQGGLLKGKWWCYGDAPKQTGLCTNKQDGAEAKGSYFNYSGANENKSYTNGAKGAKKGYANNLADNACNIIFDNNNSLQRLTFGGTAAQCKNRLSVIIPALGGTGSGLGELPTGMVLTDFYLHVSRTNYLKAGPCPSSKNWAVKTKVAFSNLLGETGPIPAAQTITSTQKCKS